MGVPGRTVQPGSRSLRGIYYLVNFRSCLQGCGHGDHYVVGQVIRSQVRNEGICKGLFNSSWIFSSCLPGKCAKLDFITSHVSDLLALFFSYVRYSNLVASWPASLSGVELQFWLDVRALFMADFEIMHSFRGLAKLFLISKNAIKIF